MAKHLIHSNLTIKAIRANDARTRLSDGDGLYLLLFVKGGSHSWRFDYTFDGRRKTLSFGTYPDTTVSLARKKADDARQQVRNGIDPSDVRKAAKKASERRRDDDRRAGDGLPPVDSFEASWARSSRTTRGRQRYAVATSRAESDPSRDLRGALTPWKPQHYATLTEPREVGRCDRLLSDPGKDIAFEAPDPRCFSCGLENFAEPSGARSI